MVVAILVLQHLLVISPIVARAAGSTTVVISEFRVRGPNGAADEFIELFNLSSSAVNIGGWRVSGSNSSGSVNTRATIPSGTTLQAGCYYLITNSSTSGGPYSGSVTGNHTFTTGITDDGGIALIDASNVIIDQVGMSSGSAYKEGTPLTNLGTSNLNRSYERKPGGAAGNGTDTDNNANDFQLITPSNPQNSSTCNSVNNPSGTGAANPNSVQAGDSTLLTVAVTPGTNPTSIGLDVTGNLTAIGGSAAQTFYDDGTNGDVTAGDNIFSFNATVSSDTTAGNKNLSVSISDTQNRTGSATINLSVTAATQPTNPSGTGSANPNPVLAGSSTLLTVNVTPGTNPASSGITVTGDLSSIGGASTQTFTDNGNNLFIFQAIVASNTTAGPKAIPVTILDAQNRTGSTTITLTVEEPAPPVNHVVISQIYGGGGNSGATYRNDYVELYNPGTVPFDLGGWTIQYAAATGTTFQAQPLGGVIQPGEYYLVSLASGGANGSLLPVDPNVAGGINMSATTGKVALVSNGDPLEGACPLADPTLVDFVGYGTANCREGATNAPAPSNTTAIFRKNGGFTDTNVNGSDFITGTPNPRRTTSIVEIGPYVLSTDPRANASNAPRDASINVTFTEAVDVQDGWFNINCVNTGAHNDATFASNSGNTNWIITPNANFQPGEQCTVTIFKNFVHDQDLDDSEPNTDTLTADKLFTFTVSTGTAPPYDPDVHLLMGNPTNATTDVNFPDNYLMEKPEFALSYNRDRGTPNWVSWHLSDEWVGSLSRVDTFRPDPAVPSDWYRVLHTDYSFSGFDRGHMVPNADRDKETSIPINQATFLMTNMIPQSPDNNQGPWANMENYLRTLLPANELYIVAGGAGTGGTGSGGFTETIANGKVVVPAWTWKVALVIPKGENDVTRVNGLTRTVAVIMPNAQGIRNDNWENYLSSVDAVEQLTGYDFFSNLADAVENSIEAGVNGSNPPGVEDISTTTSEDTSVPVTLTAVNDNDNPLNFMVVTQPQNGTLSGAGANLTYTPNANYFGADSFTFKAIDGLEQSNIATVNITVTPVNDAPTLAPIPDQTVYLGNTLTLTARGSDVDLPPQTLAYSLVGTVPAGAAINSSTGEFSWTPDGSQFGQPYQITVQVIDSENLSSQQTFTITIADNVAPVVTINTPTEGAVYALNQNIPADYSCADSGSGIESCTGTVASGVAIDTSSVGAKTFTVSAFDKAGNETTKTINYTVGFNVVVLFDQTKQNDSGSTIPIKVKIIDSNGTNLSSANIQLTAVRVEPGNLPAQSSGNSNSANLFSFDPASQSYQFNLKSEKNWSAGTYQLIFRIAGDPAEHSVSFNIR